MRNPLQACKPVLPNMDNYGFLNAKNTKNTGFYMKGIGKKKLRSL